MSDFLRFIVCTGILYAFYYYLLQHERMHHYNRAYLIGSLLIALIIPFISFEYQHQIAITLQNIETSGNEMIENIISFQPSKFNDNIITSLSDFPWLKILYILITGGLLIRFVIANWIMIWQANKHQKIRKGNRVLVLLPECNAPYSYLNYIFFDKKAYEKGQIAEEIIAHELAHVQQKHTLDLLFIEILIVFCWFNPFLFLYKRAIRLNHEFLADKAVVDKHNDIIHYQQLIMQEILHQASWGNYLSSPFNYLETKKRLKMMTKQSLTHILLAKKIGAYLLMTLLIVLFSQVTIAQQSQQTVKSSTVETKVDNENIVQALETILSKYKKPNSKKALIPKGVDKDHFLALLKQLPKGSDERKKLFVLNKKPMISNIPSQALFDSWKETKKYGIWIDGQRVRNEVLTQYQPSDFPHYSISLLAKNTVNYGKHTYQLNLMTKTKFDAENKFLETEEGQALHIYFADKAPK